MDNVLFQEISDWETRWGYTLMEIDNDQRNGRQQQQEPRGLEMVRPAAARRASISSFSPPSPCTTKGGRLLLELTEATSQCTPTPARIRPTRLMDIDHSNVQEL